MTSVKCPQCGLVYWSTAENCKRCGLLTDDMSTVQPESYVQQAPAPTTGRHSQISDADAERLLSSLKKCSRLFYFIGGLQILAWFFLGNLLIFDGVCNIGLSYVANKFKSRIAAGLLLLMTLLSVVIGLLAMAMGAIRFNLFAPLILLWRLATSIRMVYITFKLNAYEEVDVTRMMPPLPPVFHKEEAPQWAPPAGSAQWQPSE
jgi:hypothetical protein